MDTFLFFLVFGLAPPSLLADTAPEWVNAVPELELIRKIPHSGYSEGLDFHEGYLWHATPKAIVKISPKDGSVVSRFQPATDYSESLVWFKDVLWNLSYSDSGNAGKGIYSGVLRGDKIVFTRQGSVPEDKAWGMTHNGEQLIVTGTHGSQNLYFLDPKTLKLVKSLKTPIKDLEDLAWDGEGIWTSSFTEHRGQIFRINPNSGAIDAHFRLKNPEQCPIIDGIAYDKGSLWVTGKNCASIWQYKRPRVRAVSVK